MRIIITVVTSLLSTAACKFPFPADVPDDGGSADAHNDALADAHLDAPPPPRWLLLAANARTINNNPAEPLRVYAADTGNSYRSVWTSTELDWGRSVAWADMDADGDLDFAVGNGFGTRGRNRVYRNDGSEQFSLIWTAASAAFTSSIAWADVDRDGDLDVVASADKTVRVYRRAGGTFDEINVVDAGFSDVFGIDVGDIEGDGDPDLAVATSSGASIYLNNGTGVYAPYWQGPAENVESVSLGDYDRDGDLDLALGFTYGLQVYQRTSNGMVRAFHSGTDLNPGISARTGGLAWLDYDGDQDLDLVAAHCQFPAQGGACTPAPNRVYRNTGGTFTVGWTSSETDLSQGVAVGDFNNDGRPDLAFANHGANRIYQNVGGAFVLVWTSQETEFTGGVAWGAM